MSSYSGKIVHQYQSRNDDGEEKDEEEGNDVKQQCVKATFLGWESNFTDRKAAQRQLQGVEGRVTVDDLLLPDDIQSSSSKAYLSADLPRELALLDIVGSLPRLSTLPGTGGE